MTDRLTKVAEDSARGSFFLISGSAVSTVIMAVQAIVITNLLGPELYGQYTLALLVPQVIFLVTDLGLGYGITRFVAAYNARGESANVARLVKRTLLLKIVIGFLFFVILFVFAGWFASFLQRSFLAFYIQIASISILFQVLLTTVSSAFIGLDKTEYSAIISNLQAVTNTVVSIGLVVIGFGIAGSIIGTVAGYVTTGIVSVLMLFMVLRKMPKAQSISDAGANVKKMMVYSAPLYVSLLLAGIISYYQYFVLARSVVDADIGNYKAALNFGALIAIVSAPLTTVLLPAFCKLESCSEDRIRSFFKIVNKYSALLVAPVAIFIMVFSNQMVDVIYRGEFPSAGEFLAIYCLVYLLVGIGYITLTSFYNGLSDTKTTLAMGATTFVVLLILSPALAPILKVQGVIYAFIIASAAGTVYGAVRAKRQFKVEFDVPSVVKIYAIAAVSCIPSFLLIRFVRFPGLAIVGPKLIGILVAGLLFVLAYATLVPLMKIMTADELQKAAAVTNKTKSLSFIARPILKYEQRILQIANRIKSTEASSQSSATIGKESISTRDRSPHKNQDRNNMEMQETKPKLQRARSPTKGAIINTAKALAILITIIVIFHQDLTALFIDALKDQAAIYLLFVPILFAYLVYRKRKMLKASIPQQSNRLLGYIPTNILTGILLLLLSLLLYWYGSYTSVSSQYHILSLPVFIAGSLLFLFNTATTRQLLFPIAYLTLLTTPPKETIQINSTTLAIFSAIGFFAIAIFTAYLVRDKLWKKTAIFLVSLLTITILISFYQNTDLPPSLPLTIGIWALTILGTLIIIEASAKLLKTRIFTPKTQKCTSCNRKHSTNAVCPACSRILTSCFNPKKSDIAKIAIISLAVILILYTQTYVLALTQAHPEITIPTTSERTSISTAILPQLTNYTLNFMYRDQPTEQKSKQNASLLYAYYPTDKTRQIIWVAIGIASSTNNLPKWETNLNTSFRTRATILEQTDIQLSQIICHYLSLNYAATNTLQTVLYWYDTSTFKFNSTSQQKQAEISLVTYTQNVSRLSTTKSQLLAAANSIVNYWQPAKTWSQISLIISQNGEKLLIVVSAASILSFVYPSILTRREKPQNTLAYQKLSKENTQTVESVYNAQKTSIPTLDNILAKYANITGKPTTEAKMLEHLSQIEKISIIRMEVGNRDDEPIQTWKTMCYCK